MLNIQIDEQEVKEIYLEKIEEKVKAIDKELLFWDMKELMRRTCLSRTMITDTFFYDPRFEKFKIGHRWYFPAKETEEFLLKWLREQPRH